MFFCSRFVTWVSGWFAIAFQGEKEPISENEDVSFEPTDISSVRAVLVECWGLNPDCGRLGAVM